MAKTLTLQATRLGMVTVVVAAACQTVVGIDDKQLIPALVDGSAGSGGTAVTEAGMPDTMADDAHDVGDTAVMCDVQPGLSPELADRQVIRDEAPEAAIDVPSGYVITGVGLGFTDDRVRTLSVRARALGAEGLLGHEETLRAGDEPNGKIEAEVTLPDCYVAVGAGARSEGNNAKTIIVWGAPLSPDGSLGQKESFRGGSESTEDVQSEYIAPAARVLTGVGFRMDHDNVVGMRVVTDGWVVK